MDRDRLLSIMGVLSRSEEDEGKTLDRLQALGLGKGEGICAMHLVPVGLARPLLERLGVAIFSDNSLVLMTKGDAIEFLLSNQPEYIAALAAAHDHFAHGTLPRQQYETIAQSASEVDAINRALDSGIDVRGGAVATVFHDVRLAQLVKL